MSNTVTVRTSIEAKDLVAAKTAGINEKRAELGLRELSQSRVIELAIEKLNVSQGVKAK